MKRPNGTGGVRKLPGRRRKPYQAVVTSDQEIKELPVTVVGKVLEVRGIL